jgi:transposase
MVAGPHRLAKRPIQQPAPDLFGRDASPGMTSARERRAAAVLGPVAAVGAAAIIAAPSAHIDEASWAEANAKAWPRVGRTGDRTAVTTADNRGADVARAILGAGRAKVVVSDRFPGYDGSERHRHRWPHRRRDSQAMIGRHDEGSAVGSDPLGASNRLSHRWHGYRGGEIAWSTFLGYALPIRWGARQAPGRGASCASDKTAATCRRLPEGGGQLWTLLRVPGVGPTDNAAERALRHAVLWRKARGGTASGWGGRFVERLPSATAPCRQRGRNVPGDLTRCVRARLVGEPFPSLLPPTQAAVSHC